MQDWKAKAILGYIMSKALDWILYDMVTKGYPQKRGGESNLIHLAQCLSLGQNQVFISQKKKEEEEEKTDPSG